MTQEVLEEVTLRSMTLRKAHDKTFLTRRIQQGRTEKTMLKIRGKEAKKLMIGGKEVKQLLIDGREVDMESIPLTI